MPLLELRFDGVLTADFSVVDPYPMVRTYGPAEEFTQPLVHPWLVWVNINAIRCENPLRLDFGH
jgi:hypothetical protein